MEFGCVIGMKCSKHLQSRGDFHADAPRFIRAAVSLPEKIQALASVACTKKSASRLRLLHDGLVSARMHLIAGVELLACVWGNILSCMRQWQPYSMARG